MQTNTRLQVLIEGTIIAAIAIVLSLIPTRIGPSFEISLGVIPITLFSLRRGVKAGLFASFVWSLLYFLVGLAVILSPIQALIDYLIAITMNGLGGALSGSFQSALANDDKRAASGYVVGATFIGTFVRYFFHFIAGIFFWSQYAPEEMSPVIYSLILNILSPLGSVVVASIVLVILLYSSPRLFKI